MGALTEKQLVVYEDVQVIAIEKQVYFRRHDRWRYGRTMCVQTPTEMARHCLLPDESKKRKLAVEVGV